MERKKFIELTGSAGIFTAIGGISWLFNSCKKMDMTMGESISVTEGDYSVALPIPEKFTGSTSFSLKAAVSSSKIVGNKTSSVWGYANGILGPTFLVNAGDNLTVNFQNNLPEETNIHWHGLLVPQAMDGHPENIISSGSNFMFNFTIDQRAGTYWYHPHPHEKTAHQVFKGLAGFFIVSDSQETLLNLPAGDFDIPLVVQDKRVYVDGGLNYSPTTMDIMTGYFGQYIIVNGKWSPFHNVSTRWYRLRLLNGSTAKVYNFSFSNGIPFTLIGNDGGLLQNSVSVNSILLAPGERADVLVNFSSLLMGDEIYLKSIPFSNGGSAQGTSSFNIMKFVITQTVTDSFTPPSSLSTINLIPESLATQTRVFDIKQMEGMNMEGMDHTINGKSYDINRIDEKVTAGSTEIWIFDNTGSEEIHPMHIHGVQFQILDRVGGRAQLLPTEQGWKDTVFVMANEKVRVIMTFPVNTGKFVMHCHNLEHEDSGMMMNFEII